ncbi:Uncharacterised protein [Enterobacter cloacae]|nr:Uncharacterised protein [Enterobacter cloacae]
MTRHGFDTLLDPAFLFGGGNVHIFRADGAAVGLLERINQIAQFHRVFADGKGTYVKAFLEIGLGQRMLVTTEAISVDKLQDFYLLRIGVRVGNRRRVT